jgi:YebC/PmpR family DNA-binding regulatory protein
MGRAFEYRKERKFKRWDAMSKAFTRLGKEISMSVKQGGTDPDNNPRLRAAIQNAKAANMPKDRVEGAIKRASSKEEKDFAEVVYEGYGPHGIAVVVETATDNPTRTVSNVRLYFNRSGGSLGTTGSLDFLFQRKAFFTLNAEGLDLEELELELIDAGAEEIEEHEGEVIVTTDFTDFGQMQKYLEDSGRTVTSSEIVRIPLNQVDLSELEQEAVNKLIEKLEEDDDVQNVFHNMKES